MQGKVWLVGAGPGDVGLFTLRGKQVLERADVVVYDALVGQGVLGMIPEGAQLIDVGKRCGDHTMPQWQMNELLLKLAMEGKKVVRLKGGDPFLFGRGGEELSLLAENNIPFEVVPGVTSAISVPAYNGIPVTHRDYTQSVHIITGHRKAGTAYDIDFDALVKTKGTLVFLMGLKSLPDITAGLIAAGMDPKMPSAVLQQGTTACQRRVVAPLEGLEEAADKAGIHTPAIIVVGKVCQLAEEFYWYERKPLSRKKILVTRPKELISEMSAKLREMGAEVLELPAIRTVAIHPNAQLAEAFEEGKVEGAWDYLVFTSPTGVRIFFEELAQIGDIRDLAGVKVAAIGKGTAKALREKCIHPDFMPSVADGKHLGEELAAILPEGARVLIPRAALGGEELVEELRKVPGIILRDVATYETIYEKSAVIDEKAAFESGEIDYAVFTSASTVRGFAKAVEGLDCSKVKAVCIGKQTEREAASLGMQTFVAKEATMDSVVEKLVQTVKEDGNDRE